ncbi:MAG: sigma-54-dependent transcriptional regulator [Candidatus Brocadiales bacterium]
MGYKARILVVDDEEAHAKATAESLEKVGYKCIVATGGREALRHLRQGNIDIVVTDLVMKDVDGMEILRTAKKKVPDVQVMLITGYGTVETAVKAMQNGAVTFLEKPVNIHQLRIVMDEVIKKQATARNQVEEEIGLGLGHRNNPPGIIGNCASMKRIMGIIKRIAPTNAIVLIVGESGTGKELIARAIHNNSTRRNSPFVALNSAAIPEGLLESELFGHERGAFTGASSKRKGKFEHAHGGTLFLDEIGDMSPSAQAKLLRVVEDGEVIRVGSNRPIFVDVRIIAATNQNLEELIKTKNFREDLYFRLNVVCLKLPPLRERQEDILHLADAFVNEYSQIYDKRICPLTPEVKKRLLQYSWPGNIRELKNCIESMVVLAQSDVLGVEDIPAHILLDNAGKAREQEPLVGMSLAEMERKLIQNTLASVKGNRGASAKLLGIGERTLYRKLDRYGLK